MFMQISLTWLSRQCIAQPTCQINIVDAFCMNKLQLQFYFLYRTFSHVILANVFLTAFNLLPCTNDNNFIFCTELCLL